jgi:hypothetical protein
LKTPHSPFVRCRAKAPAASRHGATAIKNVRIKY